MQLEINSTDQINWNADVIGQIANNVSNLLKTRLGELPFARGVGMNTDYIDAPITLTRNAIINEVYELIKAFEPSVTVISVDVIEVSGDGDIEIKVVVDI